MDLVALYQSRKQFARFAVIVGTLSRYGLADWLQRIPESRIRELIAGPEAQTLVQRPLEERVRRAFTELGATFIKLGQVLSTRPDLVGPELATELRMLQAGTPPDPPDVVRQTIEESLGGRVEELFAEFDLKAFASASIGQVHRARLKGGQEVVVKVQRQGIDEKARQDLELLQTLADLVQHYVPATRAYQPSATVREFGRTLLRELDFSWERRNLERFTRNFEGEESVHFPSVYTELCSKSVLTMEFLTGIPGSNQTTMHESGADLREFSRRAARMYLQMIFRDGFYHADPHPGNYILLPGDVVGVIDCGMVGRIDDSLRETFEEMIIALFQHDAESLSEMILRAGSAPAETDTTAFSADVADYIDEFGGQSVKDLDIGEALDRLTEIIRRYRILLPSRVSLLLKTLIMLDGTGRQLNPDFSLMELIKPYQSELIRDRFKPERWLRRLRRSYRDLDRLVTTGPRTIAELLDRLLSGELEIRHEHRHLQAAVNRAVLGLLTSSLFVGSSLLCALKFPPAPLGVSIPGFLGATVAVLIGYRLVRQIQKEE